MSSFCAWHHVEDSLYFRKAPYVCPPSLVFLHCTDEIGEDDRANHDPVFAVTKRCVAGEAEIGSSSVGIISFLCHGLFGWFCPRWGSPGRLPVRRFMRSLRSSSGIELQRDFKFVVLIQRVQNGALSADVVDEEAYESIAFYLGNCSAMTERGLVGGDCVAEIDVDPSLK